MSHNSAHRLEELKKKFQIDPSLEDDGGVAALAALQVPTAQVQQVSEPESAIPAFNPNVQSAPAQVQTSTPQEAPAQTAPAVLLPSEIAFFNQKGFGGIEGLGIDISTVINARPKDLLGRPTGEAATTESLLDLANSHLNIQNKLTAQQRAEDKAERLARGEDPSFATFGNPDQAQQFIDDNNLTDYTVGLSKDGFVPTPVREQRQTIDNLIAEALDNGDFDRAVSFNNFKNAPTSDEALKTAMQFARQPADLFTLSAIARGAISLGPRGPGVRSLPKSPLIQQIYERWANQALGNFDFPEVIKESTAIPTRAEVAAAPSAPTVQEPSFQTAGGPGIQTQQAPVRTPDPQTLFRSELQDTGFEEGGGFGPIPVPRQTTATTPVGGSAVSNPFGQGDNLNPFAGVDLPEAPIFPFRDSNVRAPRFPANEPLERTQRLPSIDPAIPSPIRSELQDTGFEEGGAFGPSLDASNFAVAGQAGEGPGPSGRRTGTTSRGGSVLSGAELPSLIPESTPTFELPFDGVDIPLPVGLEPLFRNGGEAIGRPGSIFAAAGIPELSAQAQRNLLPQELEAFTTLAELAGIPPSLIQRRLGAQRTGGGQRTRRLSTAGGSF